MQNQSFKPRDSAPIRDWLKEKSKENFFKFKSLVETGYRDSVDYIQKNPATTLKVGATALAFSFLFGYNFGLKSEVSEKVAHTNYILRTINQQNFTILNSLQELTTAQNSINLRVENLEKQSKVRLDNIENKIQFKEATQKGEEHVKKMEKKRGWKKILPWNW